jgi:hypothetical protein
MTRFTLTRESYIRKGSIKIADRHSDAVAYLWQSADGSKPGASVFYGKQAKPVANYWYASEAKREAAVKSAFESRQKSIAFKAEQKASEKRITLEVGHILHTNWGYDQTNVEFYQVTKLIGRSMVEVREIGQCVDQTGFMTGNSTPKLDSFISEATRHRLNSSGVKIGHHYAWIWKGTPERWSSYA